MSKKPASDDVSPSTAVTRAIANACVLARKSGTSDAVIAVSLANYLGRWVLLTYPDGNEIEEQILKLVGHLEEIYPPRVQ